MTWHERFNFGTGPVVIVWQRALSHLKCIECMVVEVFISQAEQHYLYCEAHVLVYKEVGPALTCRALVSCTALSGGLTGCLTAHANLYRLFHGTLTAATIMMKVTARHTMWSCQWSYHAVHVLGPRSVTLLWLRGPLTS